MTSFLPLPLCLLLPQPSLFPPSLCDFLSTIRLLRFRYFEDNVSWGRINVCVYVCSAWVYTFPAYIWQVLSQNLNEESYNIFKLM